MKDSVARFPPGGCDTHVHFYDARYPAASETIFRPEDATVETYRRVQDDLGLARVVVVQPTTYGRDNRCQLEAMATFGNDARGVMVVDDEVTGAELERLTRLGVRGARFHMLPGGAVLWDQLEEVARRIAGYGWHIQLQLNGRELLERLPVLRALPTPLVVDHVGRYMPPVAVGNASFSTLLALIDTGRCWVKLSAPYESSITGPPEYADVMPLVDALVRHAPERMLWASNWPHPGRETPPAPAALAALFERWVPEPAIRSRILVDNPAELYGFAPLPSGDAEPPATLVSPEEAYPP